MNTDSELGCLHVKNSFSIFCLALKRGLSKVFSSLTDGINSMHPAVLLQNFTNSFNTENNFKLNNQNFTSVVGEKPPSQCAIMA